MGTTTSIVAAKPTVLGCYLIVCPEPESGWMVVLLDKRLRWFSSAYGFATREEADNKRQQIIRSHKKIKKENDEKRERYKQRKQNQSI